MSEVPKKIKALSASVLAVGTLGVFALTDRGSTRQGSWQVGVECPQPGDKIEIAGYNLTPDSDSSGVSGSDVIGFDCTSDNGKNQVNPIKEELLDGNGVSQAESIPADMMTVTLNYAWKYGAPVIGRLIGGDHPHASVTRSYNGESSPVRQGTPVIEMAGIEYFESIDPSQSVVNTIDLR